MLVRSSHKRGSAKRVKCSTEINKCCKSWMAEILPPLCNVTQGCYAITRRATRRESAFDNNVGLILARMICANTLPARKAELSLYNCYTQTCIIFLYTEGLWCPGAIPQEPLRLSRPEWLFCAVSVGHHCTATVLDVLWIDAAYSWCLACLDLVHGFIDISDRRREGINGGIWRGCLCFRYQSIRGRLDARKYKLYWSLADIVKEC